MLAAAAVWTGLFGHKKAGDEEAPQPDREHVFLGDGDLKQKIKEEQEKRSTWGHTLKLAYLSQGVIYGDIGTATLYAYIYMFLSTTISNTGDSPEDQQLQRENVLGIFSLMFWFLTLIALLKYAVVVVRASDSGEGGTIALYAHLCRTMGISPFGTMKQQAHRQVLAMKSGGSEMLQRRQNITRVGAALAPAGPPTEPSPCSSRPALFEPCHPPCGFLVLDRQNITRFFRSSKMTQHMFLIGVMISTGMAIVHGIFMPAFTVFYPFRILEDDGSISGDVATGTACGILVLLFVVQHIGTDRISFLFSPIIILWLLSNAAIGIHSLTRYGGYIFNGFSPRWLVAILYRHGDDAAWELFGGITLCIAGAETMFAAMGNFSAPSVSLAFCFFVYPCLILTYLGQGAFIIKNPGEDPFWDSIPDNVIWPVWALAMLASLVASQAAITSTFALVRQATALGIFPKLRTIHTDSDVEGRIFIPFVNYALMACCVAFVAGYTRSQYGAENLATPYAVSVVSVMLSTTLILLLTALVHWNISLLIIIPAFTLYALIETLLLAGVLYGAPPGAWVALVMSLAVACIMYIWWSGSLQRRNTLMQSCKGFDSSLIRVCPGAPAQPHRQLFPSISRMSPTMSMGRLGTLPLPLPLPLPHQLDSEATHTLGPASVKLQLTPHELLGAPGGSVSMSLSLRRGSTAEALHREQYDPGEYLALKGRPEQPLARASGLGLYYGESPVGMPLVMRHFLKNVDAIHEVCIILIVRFLPMPIVRSTERLLVRPVKNMPNFYQVVARYGYQDKVDHGDSFVSKLISTIMFKLEIKAGLKYQSRQEDFIQELESEGEGSSEGSDSEDEPGAAERSGDSARVFGLEVIQESYLGEETKAQEEMAKWEAEQTYSPFISRYALECLSRMRIVAEAPDAAQAAKDALTTAQVLLNAASTRVVHYRARAFTHPGRSAGLLHRLYNATIGVMYSMMESLSFSDSHAWHIPADSTVELGIALEI